MSNADLFRRHLALVGRAATDEELDIYDPEVVTEFPYAPEGHTRKLEGREALARFLANIGKFSEGFTLGEPSIHETSFGVIAEYHGDATFKESGRPYSQDYVAVATISKDRITHLREYYDPLRVLRALGEID